MTDTKTKWGNTVPGENDWFYEQSVIVGDFTPMKFTEIHNRVDWYHKDKQPIPLTPEVMGKIEEFNADEEYIELGYRMRFYFSKDFMPRGIYFHFGGSWKGHEPIIIHLHHLQQLCRLLTGKELTINWE